MPKKILIFSLAYYPHYVSGAEAAIKEITERIDDIEFHLITLRFDPTDSRGEKIGNVLVYRVGSSGSYVWKMLFPFIAALKGLTLHKSHNFNALWVMMTYMLIPTALFRIFGPKIPYVLTLQDGDPYEKVFGRLRIKPFIPLIDYGFRNANIIQVLSKYLSEWPQRRGYQGEVIRIPNGANPANLKESFSKETAEKAKRELGKKEGDVYLLTIARLVHQKGLENIIKALSLLPSNISFICGGGGELEVSLKKLAVEVGVFDRVVFLGPLERTDVPTYRNRIVADIWLYPSRSEGLGHAALSAMAARLPVIATQEGGLAEFIFDKKRDPDKPTTAWAVDKDNPEQIAEAVKDILANPEKVKSVTETARNMVLEKFDWDKIAVEMREKVFAKVL